MRRKPIARAVLVALVFFLGSGVASAGFNLDLGSIGSMIKLGKAIHKASQEITPEQEYYLGRAVGAKLLGQYKPLDDFELNRYLNLIGLALAAASDMPSTFGGYHFLALDTDEVNGFACPGGLILVSRGLIELCRSEDELAAVLAHEIGHVQYRHGVDAIKKGRLSEVGKIIAMESFERAGGAGRLVSLFSDSVGDVVKALAVTGYSREQEYEADLAAVTIVKRVGYDQGGLVRVLSAMKERAKTDRAGFFKTHPDPADRIEYLVKEIDRRPPADSPLRRARFEKAMAKR